MRRTRQKNGRAKKKLSQEILQEQIKLIQVQKHLQSLITKVKEQLNVLKVEELQLRSNAVQTGLQQIKTEPIATVSKTYDFDKSTEAINKQNLDLDVLVANAFRKLGEEEDDD